MVEIDTNLTPFLTNLKVKSLHLWHRKEPCSCRPTHWPPSLCQAWLGALLPPPSACPPAPPCPCPLPLRYCILPGRGLPLLAPPPPQVSREKAAMFPPEISGLFTHMTGFPGKHHRPVSPAPTTAMRGTSLNSARPQPAVAGDLDSDSG